MTLFGPEDPTEQAKAGSSRSKRPTRPVRDSPSVRLRLVLAYDGSGFRGFADQPGQCTVAGTLAAALEKILGHPVELTCAGRTDAGVHALGQVVHLDVGGGAIDLAGIVSACNKMLAPAVVIRQASPAPPGFDARRSALSRRYRYRVLNRPVPDPFEAGRSWHVEAPLDVAAMRLAADPLLGEHDFSAFCRRPRGRGGEPVVRRVLDARWSAGEDGILAFEIEATSFCHQMVRSIVGTLVEVGRGKRRAGDVTAVLGSRDRSAAAQPAPPHGLFLLEVRYPPEDPEVPVVGADPAPPISL